MARFYLHPDSWSDVLCLTDHEARHLSQVLRMKIGEEIVVFDGHGQEATAEIISISRDRVSARALSRKSTRKVLPAITLAQAIPKGKNMDLIVQKAVELGVSAIQPLITRYTVVQPGEGKSEKWRRTCLEACKQCGQNWIPKISDSKLFASWIQEAAQAPGLKLIASLAPGARPFREILRAHSEVTQVIWLVGPEGDFSEEETSLAIESGFIPVSLGEIVLRVETATFYGLSALRYEFDCDS